MQLKVDCADLPYILRAYFAFKRRLPFGFVAADARGARAATCATRPTSRPTVFRTWRDFRTARQLLAGISVQVHSGMYRTAPDVQRRRTSTPWR